MSDQPEQLAEQYASQFVNLSDPARWVCITHWLAGYRSRDAAAQAEIAALRQALAELVTSWDEANEWDDARMNAAVGVARALATAKEPTA